MLFFRGCSALVIRCFKRVEHFADWITGAAGPVFVALCWTLIIGGGIAFCKSPHVALLNLSRRRGQKYNDRSSDYPFAHLDPRPAEFVRSILASMPRTPRVPLATGNRAVSGQAYVDRKGRAVDHEGSAVVLAS
jgi:hypothetical protein